MQSKFQLVHHGETFVDGHASPSNIRREFHFTIKQSGDPNLRSLSFLLGSEGFPGGYCFLFSFLYYFCYFIVFVCLFVCFFRKKKLTKERSRKNVMLLFTYLFYLRRRLSIFRSSTLLQLWKKTLHLAGKVAPLQRKIQWREHHVLKIRGGGCYRKGSSDSLLLKSSQTVIELRFTRYLLEEVKLTS